MVWRVLECEQGTFLRLPSFYTPLYSDAAMYGTLLHARFRCFTLRFGVDVLQFGIYSTVA